MAELSTALPPSQSPYSLAYRSSPMERIRLIREGVAAESLIVTSQEMGLAKERILSLLHFTRATVNRRLKAKAVLPADYSERVIGLHKLIGQVETMVANSGAPLKDGSTFNAAQWVAKWLETPLPALNQARPADYMDTIEGQDLISSLLSKMLSGAYA